VVALFDVGRMYTRAGLRYLLHASNRPETAAHPRKDRRQWRCGS